MPQQPVSAVVVELDPTKVAAIDMGNPVVLRQPLVHERVVGRQQLGDTAVTAQDAVNEQLGLAPKRLSQVLVKAGEEPDIRLLRIDIAKEQPLLGEVGDQRLRPRVPQHATHLPVERGRLPQLPAGRRSEQIVVGNAAPQEEGQTRRQLEIAHAVDVARADTGGVALDPEQELGTDEHPLDRALDAPFEAALDATLLVERHEPVEVGVSHRATVGAPREHRQDGARAGRLVSLPGAGPGLTDKDVPPTRGVAGAVGPIGPADDQAGDGRLPAA